MPHFSFRAPAGLTLKASTRAAVTGQSLTEVCVQAMTIGLDVLDIEAAAQRSTVPLDVTEVIDRIAAALGTPPPYERRTGRDRRLKPHQILPGICSCCQASIRTYTGEVIYYRMTDDGVQALICPDCRHCPPGYVHTTIAMAMDDPAAAYRAAADEINRPEQETDTE